MVPQFKREERARPRGRTCDERGLKKEVTFSITAKAARHQEGSLLEKGKTRPQGGNRGGESLTARKGGKNLSPYMSGGKGRGRKQQRFFLFWEKKGK